MPPFHSGVMLKGKITRKAWFHMVMVYLNISRLYFYNLQAKISESPIAKIFGGQLRSILHQQGSKESATLEPFFTLQLDVHVSKVFFFVTLFLKIRT